MEVFLRIGAIVALIVMAGCAGWGGSNGVPAAPNAHSARKLPMTLQGGAKHVFLADAVFNIVTIFNRDGSTGTLSGFDEPQGLASDGSGNLYVADTINARVAVFAPPYDNKTTSVLSDPGEWPVDVATAKDGTVAAVNICQHSGSQCDGPGSIVFYANNTSQKPCATVRGKPYMTAMLWDGFDATGNLYFTAVKNYSSTLIARVSGECRASSVTVLKPSSKIVWAAGIQADTHNHIVILNGFGISGAPTIDVFKASPTSRKLKLLSAQPLLDSGTVSSFALTKDGSTLYTAEPHYSLAYAYPNGGYAEGQLSPPSVGDLIEGVAVVPAEVP
jgi:NHL repeat-containing protein